MATTTEESQQWVRCQTTVHVDLPPGTVFDAPPDLARFLWIEGRVVWPDETKTLESVTVVPTVHARVPGPGPRDAKPGEPIEVDAITARDWVRRGICPPPA